MARVMKDSGIEWIGEIPEEWEVTKAKYILSANDGGVWGNDPADDGNDKIVIRSTEQTIDGKWCIDAPAMRDLSTVPHDSSRVLPGDLLITKSSGSDLHIGKTTLADEYFESNECYFSNFIQRIRCKDYLPKLLWYLFNSNIVREQFVYLQNTTSGIGNINADIIDNLFLPNPPLTMQQRIADFLDRKCAEIDAVIEKTKATIEEYKKLKQSVITEAVTKGIRGNRAIKDSGIEWIGEIPEEWDVVRIKNLFDYRNERNFAPLEEVNLISLYTDMGVVQHCDLEATTGNKASNADGYKLVYEDDIVVNIILCWMGAIGRSAYTGVTSPAYDVYAPTKGTISKFYHHLFRTQGFSGDCYKAGRGIMAMRWRTYSDQFRALKVVCPPAEEQEEIIVYLDQKCAALDTLIAKKTALLTELETYKKSLIYEYVTGKTECIKVQSQEQAPIVYPSFPAAVNTNKPRFAQAVLMSKILDSNVKQMGRVKLEKMLYTIENSIGFDFDTEYVREAAGPLHSSIYECEGIIGYRNKWFTMKQSQYGVSYTPTSTKDKYKKYYDKYFGNYDAEINRIISVFRDYTMDQAEIVATLFAAWNDAIIDQKQFTDEDIVDDVLNNWHDNKKRFAKEVWLRAMAQMKQNNIVPKGYGKRTVRRKECNA